MDPSAKDLTLQELVPGAKFGELHTRTVDLPIEKVWPAALSVTGSEVRTLAPLFALRGIPGMLRGKRPPQPVGDQPLLDLFVEEGFIVLRRDSEPVDGRASLIFGAIGKFWSPTGNHPKLCDSLDDFIAFDEPGFAKTVARVDAITNGDGTRLETETIIAGTDRASDAKFAPYWAIIRGPSGLIRRSWLAGIDRRANRG